MGIPVTDKTSGFRLKGWHVLAGLLAVFAVVGGVNIYMVYKATSTLRGLDEKNAYERGVAYEKDIEAARIQEERRWNVDIAVRPVANHEHTVTVTAVDKAGKALAGLSAELVLNHPSDSGKDQPIVLTETGTGIFTGKFAAETGKWYLQLKLDENGETKFRSRNSIALE